MSKSLSLSESTNSNCPLPPQINSGASKAPRLSKFLKYPIESCNIEAKTKSLFPSPVTSSYSICLQPSRPNGIFTKPLKLPEKSCLYHRTLEDSSLTVQISWNPSLSISSTNRSSQEEKVDNKSIGALKPLPLFSRKET